jgi:hypothetical protein
MFGLSVWSTSVVYVDGSCPSAERYFPFIDWYTDTTPFSSGELARLQFLSSEMVAASKDSAVMRRFLSDGFIPLKATDCQLEPRYGRPFPGPGPATDRWFKFREFYYSQPCIATRRLFLEHRVAEASLWLQCWAFHTWEQLYKERQAAIEAAAAEAAAEAAASGTAPGVPGVPAALSAAAGPSGSRASQPSPIQTSGGALSPTAVVPSPSGRSASTPTLRRLGSRRSGRNVLTGDANFKIPALTLLTQLFNKGLGAILSDPFKQPEWDGNTLVNVRQATVIRSATFRSKLNVFSLTMDQLDAQRKLAETALVHGKTLFGSSSDMFDHSYVIDIFAEDDNFGRERDGDMLLNGLGADRGQAGTRSSLMHEAAIPTSSRLPTPSLLLGPISSSRC